MELKQGDRHLHEQTGLSAGTVTDNDQLATDLSHLRDGLMGCDGRERELRAGAGDVAAVGGVVRRQEVVVMEGLASGVSCCGSVWWCVWEEEHGGGVGVAS